MLKDFFQRCLPFRFRRARACRHAGQHRAAAGEQDHTGAVIKAEEEVEDAERQCEDGPPSQALSASSPPQHMGLHKTHAKHIVVKHVAPAQTRLNLTRRARVSAIARRALASHRPAHAPFASLMAVGWRALNFSRAKVRR